jgi:hypothetical protein
MEFSTYSVNYLACPETLNEILPPGVVEQFEFTVVIEVNLHAITN